MALDDQLLLKGGYLVTFTAESDLVRTTVQIGSKIKTGFIKEADSKTLLRMLSFKHFASRKLFINEKTLEIVYCKGLLGSGSCCCCFKSEESSIDNTQRKKTIIQENMQQKNDSAYNLTKYHQFEQPSDHLKQQSKENSDDDDQYYREPNLANSRALIIKDKQHRCTNIFKNFKIDLSDTKIFINENLKEYEKSLVKFEEDIKNHVREEKILQNQHIQKIQQVREKYRKIKIILKKEQKENEIKNLEISSLKLELQEEKKKFSEILKIRSKSNEDNEKLRKEVKSLKENIENLKDMRDIKEKGPRILKLKLNGKKLKIIEKFKNMVNFCQNKNKLYDTEIYRYEIEGVKVCVKVMKFPNKFCKNFERTKKNIECFKKLNELSAINTKVINCYGVGSFENSFYIITEWAEMENISDYVKNSKIMNLNITNQDFIKISDNLLHFFWNITELNIHHCHINPSNILIDKEFNIKVIFSPTFIEIYQSDLTFNNILLDLQNKAPYIAPEAGHENERRINYCIEKSNVYSLGMILFTLLTAFDSKIYDYSNNSSIITQIQEDQHINQNLKNLLIRMLDLNPNARPTFKEAFSSFTSIFSYETVPRNE